eukprot:TRINITY_DN109237_c0_g1_i1.p1 TRINITY_DN109237_c0_g1~~TRINITY_DN109237_c0_g1_i1.p1  ORF type:complete len:123 (-),score=30.60 TRINITY_DN109237_c0_g1_i1:133-501(-)
MMNPGINLNVVDQVMFTAKFETEQHKILQKLCNERCVDTMQNLKEVPSSHEQLPEATRRCIDRCFHKFSETAVLVSTEHEAWQIEQLRKSQQMGFAAKAAFGTVATGAIVGLGYFLFKGGDD